MTSCKCNQLGNKQHYPCVWEGLQEPIDVTYSQLNHISRHEEQMQHTGTATHKHKAQGGQDCTTVTVCQSNKTGTWRVVKAHQVTVAVKLTHTLARLQGPVITHNSYPTAAGVHFYHARHRLFTYRTAAASML